MPRDVVTSFRIDEDLWKKARIYAIENGVTMGEFIERLLRMELEEHKLIKRIAVRGER